MGSSNQRIYNSFDTRNGEKVRIKVSDRKEYHKSVMPCQKGELNTNFSGLSDDELLENGLIFVKKYNIIPSNYILIEFCLKHNLKMLKSINKWRFSEYGGGWKGFYKAMELKTGLTYEGNKHSKKLKMKEIRKELND